MKVVPGGVPRRTDRILERVESTLEKHRVFLDNTSIRSVVLTVKMKDGSIHPRVVLTQFETEEDHGT